MLKHQDLLKQLTLEEKAALCDGADFWHLKAVPKLGIGQVMVCDGPHGLRKQDVEHKNGTIGLGNSVPATCFPTACTTACSWDPQLLREMGRALGERCLAEGVSVLLGPGVNMKRSPLCGRNFEYFSEDPVLAGEMAAAWIEGLQETGVGASLKHFAANSQETRRMTVSSVVDERALREIYLTAFEKAVKRAHPWTVMNAYNRLNGTYCSENKWLQTQVLRREWGFDGVVVSDWGAVNDRPSGIDAGNDLEMPSSAGIGTRKIVEAVQAGTLDEAALDACADRVLDLMLRAQANRKPGYTVDEEKQHALARRIAAESMVLLKNEDGVLPVRKGQKLAVIGEMAHAPRYQGAGSSQINPTRLDNALECLRQAGFDVIYARGYSGGAQTADQALLDEAVAAAARADVALVFVGLTDDFESEGFDRTTMAMPHAHNVLVRAVAEANPNTVAVLAGGAPVAIPWLDCVKGVLNTYLGGQAGAAAAADILTGVVNPSGKLAETYPICEHSAPCRDNFPGNPATVEYRESIYIGYRYYEKAQKKVRFPFGHGLSYTSFRYSDLRLGCRDMADNERLTLSFLVKNTGERDGAEIAQVYVCDVESTAFRPVKELKAFKKVFLKAGEAKRITVTLGKRAFAYFNTNIHDWHVESGDFEILVGASSADIRLHQTVTVRSTRPDVAIPDYRASAPDYYTGNVQHIPAEQFEAVLGHALPDPQKTGEIGLTGNIEDAQGTRWGGRIHKAVTTITRMVDKGNSGMAEAVATQTPIRNFISMSGGLFSEEMADGFLQILNDDKPLEGVGKIVKGVPHIVRNLGDFLKTI